MSNSKNEVLKQVSFLKTKWMLVEMNNKPYVTADTVNFTHIFFDAQNKFYGYGTCNRLMGDCTWGKTQISFFNIGRTKMGCPHLMIENELIKNLKACTNYTLQGNELKLLDNNEIVLLKFRASK